MAPYQRLRNIFDKNDPGNRIAMPFDTTGLFDQPINVPDPTNIQEPINPLGIPDTGLMSYRNRARPYMDQLKNFMMTEPNRKDYQLSKIGKALAAASGVIEGGVNKSAGHGIGIARNLMDQPYENAKNDWASKGGRLKELAAIEDTEIEEGRKLEVAIAEEENKKRDDIRQQMLAESTRDLNSARMQDLVEKGKLLGLAYGTNELTGKLELRDLRKGTITPLHQVKETPRETREGNFGIFKREENIRQEGRVKIKGMEQAHDRIMNNFKHSQNIELARLGQQLDNLSPEARNDAFNGAYSAVLRTNPGFQQELFTPNAKGELVLRDDFNRETYKQFLRTVEDVTEESIKVPGAGLPIRGTNFGGSSYSPSPITNPDPRVEEAIADLTANKIDIDEANIAEWIRQDDIEKTANPSVVLPDQNTPPIMMPPNPIGNPYSLGNFRNFSGR